MYISRWPVLFSFVLFTIAFSTHAQNWPSGKGSPVHDSDRLLAISPDRVVLEDQDVAVEFDRKFGALTRLENKRTGWSITPNETMAESFVMFAPMPGRNYDPVLGARNPVASIKKSTDGKHLTLVWRDLQSEYAGKLDVQMEATVTLNGPQVTFDAHLVNHSKYTITSVEWPILGDLKPPSATDTLRQQWPDYGHLDSSSLWPTMDSNKGYYGTNYPTFAVNPSGHGARYLLVTAPQQGVYFGTHDTTGRETVSYTAELKPGYEDSYHNGVPKTPEIGGRPARLALGAVHFPFVNSGETGELERVVIEPYRGDWHNGVDIYKQWRSTWFHPAVMPAWVKDVNAWQQLQINSAEDDLRTPYRDLPARAEEAKQNGISAIQLVGWNNGGQDRGNPSHDTDPRLGTTQELKDAIAKIQHTGVHVILFNKYTWADITTPWYRQELYKHVAVDPYGIPYQFRGYEYQTPEQLNGMNGRRFAIGCMNDKGWLDISAHEFQKVLDLGSDGMLYDEVQHHGGASYCFSPSHGHHVPASLWSGDLRLASRFRSMVRKEGREGGFLFAGEAPYDLETETYAVFYFRIGAGDIPAERYAAPFQPMMVAVSGFDDREMINRALMDRYIISYEPFNFKGDLSDFPLTLAYGKKVDALRRRYKTYLWEAEFRDTLEATVLQNGKPYSDYTVFRTKEGKHAVVVVNDEHRPIAITVHPEGDGDLTMATPESPEAIPVDGTIEVPARSAVVVMQQ